MCSYRKVCSRPGGNSGSIPARSRLLAGKVFSRANTCVVLCRKAMRSVNLADQFFQENLANAGEPFSRDKRGCTNVEIEGI